MSNDPETASVKRLHPSLGDTWGMRESDDGEYVAYTDYAAAIAERDAARLQNKEHAERIENQRAEINSLIEREQFTAKRQQVQEKLWREAVNDLRAAIAERDAAQRDLAKANESVRKMGEAADAERRELVAEVERLKRKCGEATEALEQIVCTIPPDDGLVLLSNDGPCHWDDEHKIQVYDHEHFSPLGDALIGLHKLLKGTSRGG